MNETTAIDSRLIPNFDSVSLGVPQSLFRSFHRRVTRHIPLVENSDRPHHARSTPHFVLVNVLHRGHLPEKPGRVFLEDLKRNGEAYYGTRRGGPTGFVVYTSFSVLYLVKRGIARREGNVYDT